MRLFLINLSGSVFSFLNKTQVVVSLIFLQQNPSDTIFVLPFKNFSSASSIYLIKKNNSITFKKIKIICMLFSHSRIFQFKWYVYWN